MSRRILLRGLLLSGRLAGCRLVLWRVRPAGGLSRRVLLGRLLLSAALADRRRPLSRALTDPVRQTQCGDRARINATARRDTLLTLERDQRLAGPGPEHAISLADEQAAIDQHLLHLADLLRAQVHDRNATAAAAMAEARPRSDRDHVDNAAVAIEEHHFILDDEEAVVAINGNTSISAGKAATDTTWNLEGTTTPRLTAKLIELMFTRGALRADSTERWIVLCCCAVTVRPASVWTVAFDWV